VPEPDLTAEEERVLDLVSMDEILDVTAALVAAPGQNPPGEEGPTVDVLARACTAHGLECTTDPVAPERPNLSAVLAGGDAPGLLLLGHTDVVPHGDGWSVDPLGGTVRDGRLYGRGSADMLGGLAACVAAMGALREAGVALAGPVELAAVVDEEETGTGVRHYVASGDRSGFAGCVVAEPTELQTVIAARGDAYVQIRVTGRAAHSGNPAEGRNAIHGAAAVIGSLERWHHELAAAAHPLVGPAMWSVGQVRGGTATSTVPAECVVVADRRLLPDESADTVLADVRRRVEGLGLSEAGLAVDVSMTMAMPGFETAADHPIVRTAAAAGPAAGGPDAPLGGWSAACDGGFLARDAGLPVVVLGPGSVATQAHRPDESVSLDELRVAAHTYALLALRLLGEGT